MIEKYDTNFLKLSTALEVAATLSNEEKTTHNIYKNPEGLFRVTNHDLNDLDWKYYITIYPL